MLHNVPKTAILLLPSRVNRHIRPACLDCLKILCKFRCIDRVKKGYRQPQKGVLLDSTRGRLDQGSGFFGLASPGDEHGNEGDSGRQCAERQADVQEFVLRQPVAHGRVGRASDGHRCTVASLRKQRIQAVEVKVRYHIAIQPVCWRTGRYRTRRTQLDSTLSWGTRVCVRRVDSSVQAIENANLRKAEVLRQLPGFHRITLMDIHKSTYFRSEIE
jgi:hypothetical protein